MNNYFFAQLAGVLKYTDCISAEGENSLTSDPSLTLNNLMVRFQ